MSHTVPVLVPSASAAAPDKSCEECKFFSQGSQGNEWGQPAIPGRCSAFGNKPVDLTLMTREEAEQSHKLIAAKCPKFNSPTAKAQNTATEISIGVIAWSPEDEELPAVRQASCNSCLSCVNWLPEYPKSVGLEPNTGLCVAKGTMIPNAKHREAAMRCPYKFPAQSVGDSRVTDFADVPKYVRLIPLYDIGKFRRDLMVDSKAAPGGLPTGFDPDKFVQGKTPDENKICGYVNLVDPSGSGNVVDLPVFGDVFDEIESAKIPRSTDEERPDLYIDWEGLTYTVAVAWQALEETPVLIGPAGVGKTELYRHLAWIMRVPFERISITGSTELDDLAGSTQFLDGETKFKYGRVPLAWQKPCVLLLDEPNVGPREVWQFLRPLTDNSKQLVIDAADGAPLKRHDGCYMGFAMNPAWDIKNDGTNELADADIRRLFHVFVGYPSLDVEGQIIKNHCALAKFDIPDKVLEWVQTVGVSLRRLSDSGSLPISWGLGQQIKVAKLLNWFMPLRAYNLAAGNYLDPEMRQTFLTEVQAVFPRG